MAESEYVLLHQENITFDHIGETIYVENEDGVLEVLGSLKEFTLNGKDHVKMIIETSPKLPSRDVIIFSNAYDPTFIKVDND